MIGVNEAERWLRVKDAYKEAKDRGACRPSLVYEPYHRQVYSVACRVLATIVLINSKDRM